MRCEHKMSKRKHATLNLKTKMEIIKKLDEGAKILNLAKTYNIGRATIYDIRKNRSKLETYLQNRETGTGSRQTMKTGIHKRMEESLHAWFLQQRENNKSITSIILRQKAMFFYRKIYNKTDFRASQGWLSKFKSRYGIRLKSLTEGNQPPETSNGYSHSAMFKKKVTDLRLCPDQVYHAHESGLFWDVFAKDRISFMLCTNASGSHKFKPLIISRTNQEFKNIAIPVAYKSHNPARITEELFQDWFHNDFVPEVRDFQKSKNLSGKTLLVLHTTFEDYSDINELSRDGSVHILFVPPNCGPLQNVIQTIKVNYKRKILLNAISRESDMLKTLNTISLKDASFILAECWNNLPKIEILTSWYELWPSILEGCNLDENLYNPEEESYISVQELVNTITSNSELSGERIEDWLAANEDVVDDEEVTNLIKTEKDEDTVCPTNPIEPDEALKAIDMSIRWAEENNATVNTLLELNKLRNDVILKLYYSKREIKIENIDPTWV